MQSSFLSERFLLDNETACTLYNEYVKALPVIDYHSHLSPKDIAEDRRFENLTRAWLDGDHYKWRAMRANGIEERFITGKTSDRQKFQKWAETVPKTLGNPLYHWVHMELKDILGLGDVRLDPETAQSVWEQSRTVLSGEGFSCQAILARCNVAVLCTTDDPCDALDHHALLAQTGAYSIRMFPTFRPQQAFLLDHPKQFNAWVDRLGRAANQDILTLADLLGALENRIEYFHKRGCRIADIGLETIGIVDASEQEMRSDFDMLRRGKNLDPNRAASLKSILLIELGRMYGRKDWTQQIHIGAIRNVNSRCMRLLGADAGCDAISDACYANGLAGFLDRLDDDGLLPRTILYSLNPRDGSMVASIAGCFHDAATPGKIQFGPAWWFLDHRDGMLEQLKTLGNIGLLSRFIGMTTDSRSILSLSRHDYFRRILCSFLGEEIERGRLPGDLGIIGRMAGDICCRNAEAYFRFPAAVKPNTPIHQAQSEDCCVAPTR